MSDEVQVDDQWASDTIRNAAGDVHAVVMGPGVGWKYVRRLIGTCGRPTTGSGKQKGCRQPIEHDRPCRYHGTTPGPDGWGVLCDDGTEGDTPLNAQAPDAPLTPDPDSVNNARELPPWAYMLPVDRPAEPGEVGLAIHGAVNQCQAGEIDAKALEIIVRVLDPDWGRTS